MENAAKPKRRKSPVTAGRRQDGDGEERRQRRRAAINVEQFVSSTGADRALREFKKKKERKFARKAGLLREYKKVMKQEGYEAGHGGNRKRGRRDGGKQRGREGGTRGNGQEDAKERSTAKAANEKDGAGVARGAASWKRCKVDPFAKARHEAELNRKRRMEVDITRRAREEAEKEKQAKRKRRVKVLSQRTKRGQPIMKNIIGDIVDKLQKEK